MAKKTTNLEQGTKKKSNKKEKKVSVQSLILSHLLLGKKVK